MVKSVGWLKKLKKIGDTIGKGASWVNNNIVKPMKPLIRNGVNFATSALGVPGVGSIINTALDYGSDLLDSKYGTSSNKKITNISNVVGDYLEDTQRSPSKRKYGQIFQNRLN